MSVTLSLTESEKQDERIGISIKRDAGGIRMVKGLDTFRRYFQGYENQYVLIGGAACDIVFENSETAFRATRDLDIVLIVEALTPEFGEKFWNFVQDGKYRNKGNQWRKTAVL